MARKLGKSAKQILSVLFHLSVLTAMVLAYDAGKALVDKLRGEKQADGKEKAEDVQSEGFDFASGKPTAKKNSGPSERVDRSKDGYLFRKDIPFPAHLKVVSQESSAVKIDKSVKKDNRVMEYEQAGNVIRLTLRENSGGGDDDAMIVGKPVDFQTAGNSWKLKPSKDFTLSKGRGNMASEIPRLRLRNGLIPRPSWFGKERFKAGQKYVINDAGLNLLFEDVSKGTVQLTFVGLENVYGHPCGAFNISGTIAKDGKSDGKGGIVTEELKIEKGQVLLSMLYPLVLGTHLEGQLDSKVKMGEKIVSDKDGSFEMATKRDWKAIPAQRKQKATPPPAKRENLR